MPRVRIQRKKKPWLQERTKHNFKVANAILGLLDIFYRQPIIEARKAQKIKAQIENREMDTGLKEIRKSLTIENARRVELLNAETRLKLEAKYGKEKTARALGEPVNTEDQFRPANYEGVENG